MTFWLKSVLSLTGAAVVLVIAFGFQWRTGLDLLVVALSFMPVIVRQSPRLYLLWNRLKYFALNSETTWDLSLQFRGHFDGARVETFVHRLALEGVGATELLQANPTRFLIRYRRLFTVELALGPSYDAMAQPDETLPPAFEALDVTVYEQQVSYRRSRHVLENVLVPLFEELRNEFSPASASYSLRVRFDGNNPFFGLYLRLLRPDLVSEFQFEFQLPQARSGEYVRVNKTDMVVTAKSVESLRRAVLAGLTFSAAAA